MRKSNTKRQQMEWRRNKIDELVIKGFSQSDIARMLQIDKSAVSRDVAHLKEEAEEIIKNHIQKTLPFEYQNCLKGLQEIIKESWIISINADKSGDTKEKLQSLALIKDTYSTKMELLTNANLLSDSVRFLEQNRDKILSNNNNSKKEVNNKQQEGNDVQGFIEDNNRVTTTEPTDNAVF